MMCLPTPQHVIVSATTADVELLSELVALAFHPLAPSAWLIKSEEERRGIFPGYFRILVDHAVTVGTLYTNANRTAAALWLPVDWRGPTPPADYDERLAAVTGEHVERFQAFDTTLDEHHPGGLTHQHLAILAVHPNHQGQGIGSTILKLHHRILDGKRLPAYLEASDLRTRRLYLGCGYRDRGMPIRLPGEPETLMYPMWREPIAVVAQH
jgi:GNAT superfamily N-acetyltransferase